METIPERKLKHTKTEVGGDTFGPRGNAALAMYFEFDPMLPYDEGQKAYSLREAAPWSREKKPIEVQTYNAAGKTGLILRYNPRFDDLTEAEFVSVEQLKNHIGHIADEMLAVMPLVQEHFHITDLGKAKGISATAHWQRESKDWSIRVDANPRYNHDLEPRFPFMDAADWSNSHFYSGATEQIYTREQVRAFTEADIDRLFGFSIKLYAMGLAEEKARALLQKRIGEKGYYIDLGLGQGKIALVSTYRADKPCEERPRHEYGYNTPEEVISLAQTIDLEALAVEYGHVKLAAQSAEQEAKAKAARAAEAKTEKEAKKRLWAEWVALAQAAKQGV
jgi:hypothetical protein